MMFKRFTSAMVAGAIALSMTASAFAADNSMSNFTKQSTYASNFSDVASSSWYQSTVKTCYEYNLMQGTSSNYFRPDGSLTVAQAITMADRVHELYKTGKSTLKNGTTKWYTPYVTYATENGIIKAGDFSNYDATISRADMAYIFANALPSAEMKEINTVSSLPDVTTSTARSSAIFQLYNAGVLTGSDAAGTFHPTNSITRAEAAAIIARVAIPSDRKTLSLFTTYTVNNVSFQMASNSVKQTADNGAVYYTAPNDTSIAIVFTQSDDALKDYDIANYGADRIISLFREQFAAQGFTVGNDYSIKEVSFGSVKAYRMSLQLTMSGVLAPSYAYMLIDGNSFYLVMFMAQTDDANLWTTVNSVSVNGNAVSPKL